MTQYIDWAIGQKFGVMDINVPAYITHEEVFRAPKAPNEKNVV